MSVISSRQHPIVRAFREAARGGRDTPLLLDGWHLVAEAARTGLPLAQVAVAVGPWSDAEAALLDEIHAAGVPLTHVTATVLEAISPVRTPGGIVALAERPSQSRAALVAPAPALVLVGHDLQDPGNVGAALRVAEAAGATGAAFTGASADPFGWKALRAAMGSSLRLPLVTEAAIAPLLDALQGAGLRLVATTPRAGEPYDAADYRAPTALLLGGEGPGLPPGVLARCDTRVTIPMRPPVESLNVAVTAGLLLYEARRQRAAARP